MYDLKMYDVRFMYDLKMYDVRFMYDLVICTIYAVDNRQSLSIEQSIVPRQSSNRQFTELPRVL